MTHHRLEIYVNSITRNLTCFICSPAWGMSPPLVPDNLVQSVTLNDGKNRVLVGVYNEQIGLDQIKHLARLAVTKSYPVER